jgi:hypothetical protein
MTDRIAALADRVRRDPAFLASAFHDYAESEGMEATALAVFLGIAPQRLGPLGLCRRPRSDRFAEDIERIAQSFELNADVLAAIVRRSDVLQRMRHAHPRQAGGYAAARDREEEP